MTKVSTEDKQERSDAVHIMIFKGQMLETCDMDASKMDERPLRKRMNARFENARRAAPSMHEHQQAV